MYAVDIHTHTRPFHNPRGAPTFFDPYGAKLLAAVARQRDLDGLALTNHNYGVDYENEDPVFVPGIEVTTRFGHILVVGPDPPTQTDDHDRHPAEVVAEAHDRGCAAVVAHPFRDSTVLEVEAPYDAVELNGKHPERAENVKAVAREHDLPIVGGSDTHFPFELGRVHTLVEADELTPESLVEAIRDGRVKAAHQRYLSDRLILPAYDAVHDVRDFLGKHTTV